MQYGKELYLLKTILVDILTDWKDSEEDNNQFEIINSEDKMSQEDQSPKSPDILSPVATLIGTVDDLKFDLMVARIERENAKSVLEEYRLDQKIKLLLNKIEEKGCKKLREVYETKQGVLIELYMYGGAGKGLKSSLEGAGNASEHIIANRNVFNHLMYHLAQVAHHLEVNRMSSQNLAVIFAPCLLKPPN
uniref:Rho-GAP domain-containing protein n=1 Tax=Romanomermis culicivorax TaxID=13658 RepID=A0A915L9Z3_ROMCU